MYHIYELYDNYEICYNVDSEYIKLNVSEIQKIFSIIFKHKPIRIGKPF